LPLYHPFLSFKKSIRIPEYEYIGLTSLEANIIDTQPFQRLRYITQLPGAYHVYPGASHTRFQHSLGVMHLAGEAALTILLTDLVKEVKGDKEYQILEFEKPEEFCPTIFLLKLLRQNEKVKSKYKEKMEKIIHLVQVARLGGLLHDVGHGPFSHAFELFHELAVRKRVENAEEFDHVHYGQKIIYEKIWQDEELGKRLKEEEFELAEILACLSEWKKKNNTIEITKGQKECYGNWGVDKSEIEEISKVISTNLFINQIINGPAYNVDQFNYLVLDSYRTGVTEYGAIDVMRLLMYLKKVGNDLCMEEKALDSVVNYVEAYKHMYATVYLHKFARGAELHLAEMLLSAYEEAQESSVKTILSDMLDPTTDALLSMIDGGILGEIKRVLASDSSSFKTTNKFASRFFKRDMLRLAYECRWEKVYPKWPEFAKLEEAVRQESGGAFVAVEALTTRPAPLPALSRDLLFEPKKGGAKPRNLMEVFDSYYALTLEKEIRSIRVYTWKENREAVNKALKKLVEED